MRKKILVLAGTRPEAIKLSPVIFKLKENPDVFETIVCSTGQHKEMLYQMFNDFNIVPDIDLMVMEKNQSLANLTSKLFKSIDSVLESEKPDWVLVQGDTTTVMVGSMCCFYKKIKIGHVEAGLRTFNKFSPFPEEINRRIAGILADKHFAPTERAKQNLINEGVEKKNILVTGNTAVDALLWMVKNIRKTPPSLPNPITNFIKEGYRLVLITSHRRENFDSGLEQICLAIYDLANTFRDTVFVFPVHLNPVVQDTVNKKLKNVDRVILCDPLSYKPFVWLIDKCTLILTDSGGIQEEAPSLKKPVLVMRDVTERPEGFSVGLNKLIGTKKSKIIEAVSNLLNNCNENKPTFNSHNPYGDGKAANRIIDAIRS